MNKKALCILAALALALLPLHGHALTRPELRAAWQEALEGRSGASPYQETPDPTAFEPGALTHEAQENALSTLNFIRGIAGLSPVTLSSIYSLRCQNAALLLAANGAVSHSPSQPEGMHADLYESALLGASESNLAAFNWMQPELLSDAVEYFVRDDGEANLSLQGHRRWLLSPLMAQTGFGLANAENGASFAVMYAVDSGNADARWDSVAWPAEGAFPVEMMRRELAWTLMLNDACYDLDASRVQITLSESVSGASFSFDPAAGEGDGFCALSREPYGGGSCLIFRPDLASAGIDEYVQNQIWEARVTGLVRRDGGTAEVIWRSEMTSLYPQDPVSVELSRTEATLSPGESLALSAAVIPAYADDLGIRWISSDARVAMVTASGLVTALGEGSCEIIAESINGRQDICLLTVESSPEA